MNKVILAGLTLILVRDCDIGGPRFHGQIKGTWGGENAGLMAFDTTAHVHIGCTAGDTKQAIVTDAQDRKSTRLNFSHDQISYAVFCLKKKKKYENIHLSSTHDTMSTHVVCSKYRPLPCRGIGTE